jgi:hypothetical protein
LQQIFKIQSITELDRFWTMPDLFSSPGDCVTASTWTFEFVITQRAETKDLLSLCEHKIKCARPLQLSSMKKERLQTSAHRRPKTRAIT